MSDLCGVRLAGSIDKYQEPIKLFARNLGVAFQILNDLDDWTTDNVWAHVNIMREEFKKRGLEVLFLVFDDFMK